MENKLQRISLEKIPHEINLYGNFFRQFKKNIFKKSSILAPRLASTFCVLTKDKRKKRKENKSKFWTPHNRLARSVTPAEGFDNFCADWLLTFFILRKIGRPFRSTVHRPPTRTAHALRAIVCVGLLGYIERAKKKRQKRCAQKTVFQKKKGN